MLLCGFDSFLALLPLQIKFYFLVQTSLRWMWCVFDVILFTLSLSLLKGDTCTKWQVTSQKFNCTPICVVFMWWSLSSVQKSGISLYCALSFTNLYIYTNSCESLFILLLDVTDKVIFSQPFTWKRSWYKLLVALTFHVECWECDMYTIHWWWGVSLFATHRFDYDKLLLAYGIKKGSISDSIESSGIT